VVSDAEHDDPPARDDVTAKVRTLAREVPAVVPSDPWMEQTPSDVSDLASIVRDADEVPRLPGFMGGEVIGEDETTGAEVEVVEPDVLGPGLPAPPPSLAEALRSTPQAPWPWLAEDLEPRLPAATPAPLEPSEEVETYQGDGPFAAPMDGPRGAPPTAAARFAEALRSEPVPDSRALVPPEVRAELAKPHRLERKVTPSSGPKTVGELRRGARQPAAPAPAPAGQRHYPKMRALLADPDSVPYGTTPPTEPPPPPVPGTFFPSAPPAAERPRAADLDGLLLTMAEGLLIGEGPDGGTEVRVTLRDEFFAGTELRIGLGDGIITATLIPPDRTTYWALSGNVAELESRLVERGLRVQQVKVLEP